MRDFSDSVERARTATSSAENHELSHSTNRRRFIAGLAALGTATLPIARAAGENEPRYAALALQTVCDSVTQDSTPESARERMFASIKRIKGQIAAARGFLRSYAGMDLKLVVLPEYFLTAFPQGESREEWKAKAAVDVNGPEYEALAEIAQRYQLYLAGNLYENDAAFPSLYFQANTVIGPTGNTLLRYRRMISLYTPSPFDVWDAYLDKYGLDAVFPVTKTEIGTLGTIASEEILYPEVARMLAMKGAEVLLHPTSETASPSLTIKDVMKRARAIENMAYLVSANTGGITGSSLPMDSADAMSKIVDWKGKVLAEAESGESMAANSVIELSALRAARRRTGMSNLLARQPFAAYADAYGSHDWAQPNAMANGKMLSQPQVIERQRALIDKLVADGVMR